MVLDENFKSGGKVECVLFGEKRTLEVRSANKRDGEILDGDEKAEVDWLLSANVFEDKAVYKAVLKYINKVYALSDENHEERTNLAEEIDITGVLVDISHDDAGGEDVVTKIVAFCGETPCDEEHGISVSFKARKFMSVQDEANYNDDPDPAFNYRKWKEANPLMGMVPKSANVMIKNGFTDGRQICFFAEAYYGKYNFITKRSLKKWVLPSKHRKNFEGYAVGVKGDNLYMIKRDADKELKDCLGDYFVISKKDITGCFALTENYKVTPYLTNHFCNAHFVLADGKILIFADRTADPILDFLMTEFGNIVPPKK